jgi:hypothetical protein
MTLLRKQAAVAGLVGMAVLGSARPVDAQAAAPAAPQASLEQQLTGDAKDEYVTARALLAVGDAAGALVKFQHAYELSREPHLIWNMAVCELKLQHYPKTLDLLDRYEAALGPRLTDAERTELTTLATATRRLVSEVNLSVNETGASIQLDGEAIGTTPLTKAFRVGLGTHEIRVEKPGFRPQVVQRAFTGGAETDLVVMLEKERPTARLTVAAPAGADILIDETTRARGRWDGTLDPGVHTLRVTAAGKKPYTRKVELKTGETRTLDVTLEATSHGIPAYVWIAGAAVVAGGLATAGYFIFKPGPETEQPYVGTIGAGQVQLP